ncbi:MAG: alcohol dehydrogenase catalytic domain-containing protein [Clostridia bacterium]|jgi:2-desacetyl-2-hydroxyethyl bacteriochlorophyllide A dehydrogenase
MKAVVIKKANDISLMDVKFPELKQDCARIKVKACAICATDLELIDGNIPAKYPIIPGHEWSGIVDSVSDVKYEHWLGKRVTGSNDISCLSCDECRKGNIRYCKEFQEIGFKADGGYAEYLIVPAYNLCEIPDSLPFVNAALCEPLGVAVGILEKAQARLMDTLLIFGSGSIGLCILTAAKAMGLNKIVVCAKSEKRLDIAKKMGAFEVIATDKQNIFEQMEKLHPEGTDIVCDATGTEECITNGIKLTKKGGTFVLAGYGQGRIIKLRIDDIHVNNIKVVGAGNNWNVHKRAVDLMRSGLVDLSPLITKKISLEQYKEGFEAARNRPEGFVKAVFML